MNRITHIALLLFFLTGEKTNAQDRFGVEAGIGSPTFGHVSQYDGDITHSANRAFTMEVNYLRKVYKHIYVGANLSFQRYNFYYYFGESDAAIDVVDEVTAKINYLFLAPVIDIGIGRRHENFHFYISASIGYLLTGQQISYDFNSSRYSNGQQVVSQDMTYNSDDKIKKVVVHTNFGFQEHIRVSKLWHILIDEGFSLYSSDMTSLDNSVILENNESIIHPGYFTLQIGVMRKYSKPVQRTAPLQ